MAMSRASFQLAGCRAGAYLTCCFDGFVWLRAIDWCWALYDKVVAAEALTIIGARHAWRWRAAIRLP